MYLVEIFLPLTGNDGARIEEQKFRDLKNDFVERFGGATFYEHSPANGLWKEEPGTVQKDLIIRVEVMVDNPDLNWWKELRSRLEVTFRQKEILARMTKTERI